MSLLFWHFINTTAHYLTDTSLHLPLLKSSMDKVIQINMSLSQIDWYWTLQSRINIEILNTKPPDLMDNLLITFENCTFYMSNFFFEKVFSSRPRKGVIWRVVHTAPNHFRQKKLSSSTLPHIIDVYDVRTDNFIFKLFGSNLPRIS